MCYSACETRSLIHDDREIKEKPLGRIQIIIMDGYSVLFCLLPNSFCGVLVQRGILSIIPLDIGIARMPLF